MEEKVKKLLTKGGESGELKMLAINLRKCNELI